MTRVYDERGRPTAAPVLPPFPPPPLLPFFSPFPFLNVGQTKKHGSEPHPFSPSSPFLSPFFFFSSFPFFFSSPVQGQGFQGIIAKAQFSFPLPLHFSFFFFSFFFFPPSQPGHMGDEQSVQNLRVVQVRETDVSFPFFFSPFFLFPFPGQVSGQDG